MSQGTRSQIQKLPTTTASTTTSSTTSTTSQGAFLTQAEVEIMHKQLDEKEKMIREQANALRREREEINQQQSNTVELESIMQVLKQLQTDITPLKNLPEKLENLEQRVSKPSLLLSQPSPLCPDKIQKPAIVSQPTLKIKDVLPNVPNYDGYTMTVFQFSRACERARDLLPSSQEPQLVQLIINKLEGDAYQVVEGTQYNTVTELLDKLKTIFAPCKTVSQYRGELANIYKLPNETVLKYAGRVKDLKTAIIDCYRRERGGVNKTFADEIDSEVLEAFTNGLPSELITRIEHRAIGSLDQAIEWAIKLSRTLEIEKTREKRYAPRSAAEYKPSRTDTNCPQTAPAGANQSPVKILSRSSDTPRPFIRPLVPGVPGPNSPNVCRYCKFPGHDISACRKLAYRNAQNSGNAQGNPATQGASQGLAQNVTRPVLTCSQPGPSHEKEATADE